MYIRAVGGDGATTAVSAGGGTNPLWSRGGRELLYLGMGERVSVMAVDVAGDRVGSPRALFEFDRTSLMARCEPNPCFAASRDGERFYAVGPATTPTYPPVTTIELVLNWTSQLTTPAPAPRVP